MKLANARCRSRAIATRMFAWNGVMAVISMILYAVSQQ